MGAEGPLYDTCAWPNVVDLVTAALEYTAIMLSQFPIERTRRSVNVFTDLQSTCDFVFWHLFYLL